MSQVKGIGRALTFLTFISDKILNNYFTIFIITVHLKIKYMDSFERQGSYMKQFEYIFHLPYWYYGTKLAFYIKVHYNKIHEASRIF